MASITKASSPEEEIIAATKAPRLIIPCEYNETAAKPPIQPGIRPSSEPAITCLSGEPCSRPNQRPAEATLTYSIMIIITITKEVMSHELRRTSLRICQNICYLR